ncbi:Hypothetical protein D9617_18g034570 [Elsinoe fawcettii]|nr:Hypothetical protein D9617_18g034570 [Elsinoe fawcettii]
MSPAGTSDEAETSEEVKVDDLDLTDQEKVILEKYWATPIERLLHCLWLGGLIAALVFLNVTRYHYIRGVVETQKKQAALCRQAYHIICLRDLNTRGLPWERTMSWTVVWDCIFGLYLLLRFCEAAQGVMALRSKNVALIPLIISVYWIAASVWRVSDYCSQWHTSPKMLVLSITVQMGTIGILVLTNVQYKIVRKRIICDREVKIHLAAVTGIYHDDQQPLVHPPPPAYSFANKYQAGSRSRNLRADGY